MQDQNRKLGIIRGGMYGQRDPRSHVVRQAALELQERIVAMLGGKRKSRVLGRVQDGETTPLNGPLKIAAELKDARVSYEEAHRTVMVPQERALARLYGRDFDTGEFSPPGKAA
jgi:hypothetical protein